jgi:hypothetical protein
MTGDPPKALADDALNAPDWRVWLDVCVVDVEQTW